MILAVDIGNTNIVIGCIDDQKTYFVEQAATDIAKTDLEYAVEFKTVLELYGIDMKEIQGAIISSVVPPLVNVIKRAVAKIVHVKQLVVGPGVKTGLNICMDNPGQVGSDLVVHAVAGIRDYGAPLIVIDLGTATTISVIDEKKNYIPGSEGITGVAGKTDFTASAYQPGSTEAYDREKYDRMHEKRDRLRAGVLSGWNDRPGGGGDRSFTNDRCDGRFGRRDRTTL